MSETEKLLATSLTVTSGKESFEFSIPTIATSIRLGTRARTIRRGYDTQGYGDEFGLDDDTADLAWGAAAFETLLKGCDAPNNWPYSKNATGGPVVDHTKWPDDKVDVVLEVARKLRMDLARFRAERAASREPNSEETVESGGHPGAPGPV